MTARRGSWLAGTLACLMVVVTMTIANAPAESPEPPTKPEQAKRLASAASKTHRSPGHRFATADAARQAADDASTLVPLPDGGNFSGIRWEAAGGGLTEADVALVLQYNASCQWLRAWRDNREPSTARDVLSFVGSWSALRDSEAGEVLRQMAQDVGRGHIGELTRAVLSECEASARREREYATGRGEIPTV